MNCLCGPTSAGKYVGNRGVAIGRQVKIVRQVSLWVEIDRQGLHTDRRNTSVRVRTVVVLPVPPFCESTAIVWAIAADSTWNALPSARARSGPRQQGWALVVAGHADEREPITTDENLIAIVQGSPLDAFAVDENTVETAVVEDSHAIGLTHDERVASGDGRSRSARRRRTAPIRVHSRVSATVLDSSPSSYSRYSPGSISSSRARTIHSWGS